MKTNTILQGDALAVLKTLPDESIDCVVTSPPYWALRDYGVDGQLGREPTFQEYITKLCDIFDEIKRVLKKTGTCWVNLGDTYGTQSGAMRDGKFGTKNTNNQQVIQPKSIHKCLLQIPSRFAIEMTNRGWILRNRIIWHKPNCMPSSAKDRFTVDFEELFFFVKSKKYYFEPQYERATYTDNRKDKGRHQYNNRNTQCGVLVTDKRNKRCVWKIPTKGFKEAHFAVFPEALIETPIKAGCPQYICKKCGKPRERIIETEFIPQPDVSPERNKRGVYRKPMDKSNRWQHFPRGTTKAKTKGWTDCGCSAGFRPGIIMDPFMGAGTVGVVARKQLRDYLGIDLNTEYCKMAQKRISKIPKRLDSFVKNTEKCRKTPKQPKPL